jgi:hypothetical protein
MNLRIADALQKGSAFFSFIIGLGISVLLFHRKYSVIQTSAVPINEAPNRIVKMDGKCYRFRVEDASCENVSKE